jgi:hypothetical protein
MKRLLSFALILATLLPQAVFAISLNLEYPIPPGAPDINTQAGQTLPGVAAWVYYFILMISGISAFVMIVWGGVVWLTSAGDPSRLSDAKDRIKNAVLGLLLVLASYLILQTINPQFTTLLNPI